MPFHPFRRFRLRTDRAPVRDDSDESSPERDPPRFILLKKSGEHSPDQSTLPPHSAKKPCVAHSTPSVHASPPPSDKPTLIRRVTTRLLPSRSDTPLLRSRPSTRTLPGVLGPSQGPRPLKPVLPDCPPLPNSFVSKQHREAALRERGLRPPRKDLSEQEREADERLGSTPLPVAVTFNGSTDAERLKATWLATNRDSDSSDSDSIPPPFPRSRSTKLPRSPSDTDIPRRSCEGRSDLPPPGRPSFCSSIPPLSTTSHLEVLPEEPSELPLPPPRSRVNLPRIVSTSVDCLPSPVLVESPVSCTFSSQCPGSTLESQSQSSHRPVHDKENLRSVLSRGRRTDPGNPPQRGAGSSLSRLGSRSLSNLRRSVAGSLKVPSSSTLASADRASLQAPRSPIDPTMHSLGSILRETKGIEDAESRRLSELAFLD